MLSAVFCILLRRKQWETARSQTFLVQAQENQSIAGTETRYRTADVDQFKIFYREAGVRGAPAVLLLHGFPTASHMFRGLIPLLADRFHLAAPDLPGYGQSDNDALAGVDCAVEEILPRHGHAIVIGRIKPS